MLRPCIICGATEQPKLDEEKEKMADYMYDFLSNTADEEGPGVLTDIEFNFICGSVCNSCYLRYKENKKVGK